MTLSQFNDDHLRKAVEIFFKNRTIYNGDIPFTKDELLEQIVKAKAEIQNSGLKSDEDYLKYLEDQFNNAPEKIDLMPIEPIWQDNGSGIKTVNLMSITEGNQYTFLYGVTSETEKSSLEYKSRANKYWFSDTETAVPNGVSMTRQEAQQMALETMQEMGLENVQIVSEDIGVSYDGDPLDPKNLNDQDQCYIFHLSQTIDGIPFTYVGNASGDYMEDDSPYAAPVIQESIEIKINDNGCVYFYWEIPYCKIEYVSENIKLLDFEDIKDVFLKQMEREGQGQNEWYSTNGIVNDCIKIYKIELGMMVTADQDNPDNFICIPVWDFFAHTKKHIVTIE